VDSKGTSSLWNTLVWPRLTAERRFNSIDKDGGGTIDRSELQGALRALGMPVDERQLTTMMQRVDTARGGTVSFAEFQAAFGHLRDADIKARPRPCSISRTSSCMLRCCPKSAICRVLIWQVFLPNVTSIRNARIRTRIALPGRNRLDLAPLAFSSFSSLASLAPRHWGHFLRSLARRASRGGGAGVVVAGGRRRRVQPRAAAPAAGPGLRTQIMLG